MENGLSPQNHQNTLSKVITLIASILLNVQEPLY